LTEKWPVPARTTKSSVWKLDVRFPIWTPWVEVELAAPEGREVSAVNAVPPPMVMSAPVAED
jgi:hypothetical protein